MTNRTRNPEGTSPPTQSTGLDYFSPFSIRPAYRGRHWLSVTFELGRDEVGSTTEAETTVADDLVELFATLGLGAPASVA